MLNVQNRTSIHSEKRVQNNVGEIVSEGGDYDANNYFTRGRELQWNSGA